MPEPSAATLPGAVAKETIAPLGASMGARPLATERKERLKGLLRQASRKTRLRSFWA